MIKNVRLQSFGTCIAMNNWITSYIQLQVSHVYRWLGTMVVKLVSILANPRYPSDMWDTSAGVSN